MIVSKQKPLAEILEALNGKERVFIAGCSECATICHVGGEKEVAEMKEILEKQGKEITGTIILEPACHKPMDRKLLRNADGLENADCVLVLACGSGAQTVAEVLDKEVVTGVNSYFVGQIQNLRTFEERCRLCGECLLNYTGGLCPIALCPKHILNGPCGGAQNGKCEVDREKECVWHLIYERLKKRGKLHLLRKIWPAKDWSLDTTARKRIVLGMGDEERE